MKITPVNEKIGAFVKDVSLSDLDPHEFKTLYQALLRHKVLFFRDQPLSTEEHIALGQRFGALEPPHPFFPHLTDNDQVVIIETAPGNPPSKSYWHTDMTWQMVPPKCSILHAQFVPEQGGDTIWCDMAGVWADLSAAEQSELRSLETIHALHAFEDSRYDHLDDNGESVVSKRARDYPPIRRPMMQVHPETSQEVLFINEQFTRSIINWSEAASQQRLSALFSKARQVQYQVRFSWQKGSVAIWDNRATQHFAITDYGDTPRRLHRVTVQGEPCLAGKPYLP
ncbi:TauD/TfdA dioxygenase family protein [Marinomonas gallaica]|uniref:TauD/TfdA dioxygenase family protein n=1 Tax=Marinomonas gallaica TaxID=1806667 RepID=UPI003CE4ED0B